MKVRTFAALVAIGLLAGCSGSSGSSDSAGGEVASVVSIKPPQPAASSAAPPAERPLIRTDTSPEEEQRLYDLWQACFSDYGINTQEQRKQGAAAAETGARANTDPNLAAKYKKAEKGCADKEPEEVWERAKRLDPAYADKLRDWVTCIRSQGIDAWEDDGFLAFESLPPENQMKKVDSCQDKAFGKG